MDIAALEGKDLVASITAVAELISKLKALSSLKPAALPAVVLDDLALRAGRKIRKHTDCVPIICGFLEALHTIYSDAVSVSGEDCAALHYALVALFFAAELAVKKKQGRAIPVDPIEYENWLGLLAVGTDDYVPIIDPARLGLAAPVSGGIAPADSTAKSLTNPFPPAHQQEQASSSHHVMAQYNVPVSSSPATLAAAATVPTPQDEYTVCF